MIIGVDAREIQDGVVTGIGRSLANFIDYFGKYDTENRLLLFSERDLPIHLSENIKQITLKSLPTIVWDQVLLPWKLRQNNVDLFYSPYYKIPLFSRIPAVNQVLDLMYLRYPAYRDKLGIFKEIYYLSFGKIYSNKSISIISDSRHAKNDIIKKWKIKAEKIEVIPLGLAGRYVPVKNKEILRGVKEKFSLPDKFILYLGNFKPHKNVLALVRAFKLIEKKIPDLMLVLAGPLDKYSMEIRKIVAEKNLSNKTIFTGVIKEEDQPEAILSLADVFVFPSLYEGFGLPPLEAMACGTPVIASNLTSIPEVVGDCGVLINPLDTENIAQAIEKMINDKAHRNKYSSKGLEKSKQFREENTSKKIYDHLTRQLNYLT